MTKGINEAKALLRQFRSLVSFAQLIDELGDVENDLLRRKTEVAAVESLIDKARSDLHEVEQQVSVALGSVEAARKEARVIVAEGRRKADAKVEEAAAKCRELMAKAAADVEQKKREHDVIREEIGQLSRQVEATRAEKATLEEDLRKLKAKWV